ncbi:2,5-didehydrogluconate reductase [Fictibacillus macauensis ZFHKF-1]|uniref:2,5-didehydrogluconate reductase n=1 Tax=Fictibacillus macauensis ZFHKF-1 TaxID=1196324 RepID=I8AIX5_9BACL|nr:aldo/keto reductase [Fictibacillus macauensis]EIT85717.1 2,5-didehydrogluconate reductase [Fictibacillus macauensis ZFHKF-1]
MIRSINDTVQLANGVKMPVLGLGVYKAEDGQEVINAISYAVQAGYRSIDTAAFYKNEEGVGEAIRHVDVPREELFITTKVWNDQQGYESTLLSFEESRQRLGVDYLDLFLIHWPVSGKYKDTWRALETLYKEGKVKAIGVCNFKPHHLDDLMADCEIKPMINQIEFHPRLTQKEVLAYCKKHEIAVEAWRPLLKGEIFSEPVITSIAKKHQKTPAQVILRWDLQHGVITIPKSVNETRIQENANLFDFELTHEEMKAIDELNENKRNGPDPDEF